MPDLKEILLSKNVVIPENYEIFKDIFRHFRGKQVQGIKGDDRPLLEKAEDFYLLPPSKGGFLQGDIITNIPPVWVSNNGNGSLDAFISSPKLAMILSNECDCERRTNAQSYIRLCPIFTESELLSENGVASEKASSVIGNLKANYFTEYFWMPKPIASEDHLVADLSHSFSIGLEDLYQSVESGVVQRKVSLSQDAYFLLLVKLAWLILRPAPTDTIRIGLIPLSKE